jgi:hypothetical protein
VKSLIRWFLIGLGAGISAGIASAVLARRWSSRPAVDEESGTPMPEPERQPVR